MTKHVVQVVDGGGLLLAEVDGKGKPVTRQCRRCEGRGRTLADCQEPEPSVTSWELLGDGDDVRERVDRSLAAYGWRRAGSWRRDTVDVEPLPVEPASTRSPGSRRGNPGPPQDPFGGAG